MIARHVTGLAGGLCATLAGLMLIGVVSCTEQPNGHADAEHKEKLAAGSLPQPVADALNAKFPRAQVDKCTKETEAGKDVYDIEFRQDGTKLEADIFADGTIHNWEKEIAAKDLPEPVRQAVEKKYPKSTVTEAMAVTEVKAGKEALAEYEVTLETAEKKSVELTVAPDGKITEDSTDKK